MVWDLRIYCFLNKIYVVAFTFNNWCIENPYKRMDVCATLFLKFNSCSIIFYFSQWNIKFDFFISQRLFILLIIYGSPSNFLSKRESFRKHVGIPNCLTIAGASYKNCFQCASVPLTELVNENAVLLATNLLTV